MIGLQCAGVLAPRFRLLVARVGWLSCFGAPDARWFKLHQALQGSAVALSIIALGLVIRCCVDAMHRAGGVARRPPSKLCSRPLPPTAFVAGVCGQE
jgi:hypothetical protein